MKINPDDLIRPHIKKLKPYTTARDEFAGAAEIYLDANENPFGSPVEQKLNRYPDPHQKDLKDALSKIKGISAKHIFLGNGSDEPIDLLIRIFCTPGRDQVIICPPTYGMYEVAAAQNDVGVVRVNLIPETFQPDVPKILEAANETTKLLFICSPNNPTGNTVSKTDIEFLLENFRGVVVVDEAYINYASAASVMSLLTQYPNLIVLQTLSKAWGLASLRIGMAFAAYAVMDAFDRIKPPYNISGESQRIALDALKNLALVNDQIKTTVDQRRRMTNDLEAINGIQKVFPSQANFILVRTNDADALFDYLLKRGIIVRNRTKMVNCENCLRITIGTPEENDVVLKTIREFYN